MRLSLLVRATALALTIGTSIVSASPALAAPVLVQGSTNYSGAPVTFGFGDSTFTFASTGDPFNPTAVRTGGTGQINTIFGSPTTYFVDRGTVTFGPGMQYAAFNALTTISYSNGNNFIGLRATSGTDVFFGYAFTTNNILNGVVFNNVANQAITASVNLPAAVPEPATWAMMLLGFGAIGFAMRRRQTLLPQVA
jgi:hypothetical protein